MSLRDVHDFELRLLEPCLAMSERGIRIDESRRLSMIRELEAQLSPLTETVRRVVVEEILPAKPLQTHLFSKAWTCVCCRNGAAKRVACWSCAGFSKKPAKKLLVSSLVPCLKCDGKGQHMTLVFNPNSEQQVKTILYEVLRLPPRIKDGKLRSDETALKDLLGFVDDAPDAQRFILGVLRLGKLSTILGILARIQPAPDGRIRTFYNPAGTETGRFSSSGGKPDARSGEPWALVESTNLQNMPKREATERLFDVRRCFVPDEGYAFVEADLSGAESWITAACCGDQDWLVRLQTPGFNEHAWTASHIFGKSVRAIAKDSPEYVLSKMANHALNYGMQWQTFQRNINAGTDVTGVGVDAKLAKRICSAYTELKPGLYHWWRRVSEELIGRGQLTTCFGRKRTFFGRLRGEWLGETHREAIAFEPQSTIADLLNRGLLRWWERHDGKLGMLLAQIHDAVLVQAPKERVGLMARMLRRCLEEPITVRGLLFTIPVEVTVSEHWGTRKEAA